MQPLLSVHLRDDLLCKQQEQPVGCRRLVLFAVTGPAARMGVNKLWDLHDDIILVLWKSVYGDVTLEPLITVHEGRDTE